MKKNILCVVLTFAFALHSYCGVPQTMNYQAVARDASGGAIVNHLIGLRFTIHDSTITGAVVYKETNSASTNQFGIFTAMIGRGAPVSGTFSGINWAAADKYLQVEIDVTGGASYVDMGTTQLLSVPYALYAQTAGSAGNTDGDTSSVNEIQTLSLSDDTLSLSKGGGSVIIANDVAGYKGHTTIGFGSGLTFNTLDSVIFTLPQPHKVYVQADVANWGQGSECSGEIKLSFDGVDEDRTMVFAQNRVITTGGNNSTVLTTSWMLPLGAGAHVIRLLSAYTSNCGIFIHPHLNVLVMGN